MAVSITRPTFLPQEAEIESRPFFQWPELIGVRTPDLKAAMGGD